MKNIKSVFIPLALLISCGHAFAYEDAPPQTSLFFTRDEAREADMLARRNAPAGQGDIQLGAVIYYGPDDWTFWLRNEKWTPDTLRDDFQVLEVTADMVRLLWRSDEGMQEVTLRPFQTFRASAKQLTGR